MGRREGGERERERGRRESEEGREGGGGTLPVVKIESICSRESRENRE